MTNAPVPIKQITKSFPEAGRIRLGIKATGKNGSTYPKSIDTFRLTSQYRHPLEQAAELWGGQVGEWNGQHEVVTESNQLSIIIPLGHGFDPLGGTPIYELWSGSGCTRRCDGEQVTTPETTGPDTVEMVESPCICARKGVLECSPKLRLIVGLPDLDFYGFWRLETGSMNAIRENQAMLETIAMLQSKGIHRGVLTLERREAKKPGTKTKKFVVPVLRLAGSMNELQAGATSLGALGQAGPRRPELAAGDSPAPSAAARGSEVPVPSDPHSTEGAGGVGASSPAPSPTSEGDGAEGEAASSPDEDIVDAEIVEDHGNPAERSRLIGRFHGICKQGSLDYDTQVRGWLVHHYGASLSDLPFDKLQGLVGKLEEGTRHEKQEARKKFKVSVLEHAEVSA